MVGALYRPEMAWVAAPAVVAGMVRLVCLGPRFPTQARAKHEPIERLPHFASLYAPSLVEVAVLVVPMADTDIARLSESVGLHHGLKPHGGRLVVRTYCGTHFFTCPASGRRTDRA